MRSEALAVVTLTPEASKVAEHRRLPFPVYRARLRSSPPQVAEVALAVVVRSVAAPEREALVRRLVERLLDTLDRQHAASTQHVEEAIQRALAAELASLYAALPVPNGRQAAGLGRAELVRITDYIDGNIDRTIELADLAALIKVSRFHFSRLFKRSMGTTALAYVEARRILHAQRLLTETDLPLAEIALMTGFSDQSHFTRRFRERLGSTPAAFARENGRRRPVPRQP
ncbi:AraC family transcriptional regulator [Sphingomonas trueperi]|uniref:helix-turn-helix transcriptional regulator n=1 Tax=Sphingomonas trueperi TaxID=53317 RepID=UPI003398AE24